MEPQLHLIFILSVVACVVIYVIGRIIDGNLTLPRSGILYSAFFVWFSLFVSTMFSASKAVALTGLPRDSGTFLMLTSLFLLLLFASILVQSSTRQALLVTVIFAISILAFLLQIIHIVFGISFGGLLILPSDTFIGTWYDFGILWSLIIVLSLIFIEITNVPKFFRTLAFVGLVCGSIVLIFVNFSLIWWVLGVTCLFIMLSKWRSTKTLALSAFVVLLVCVVGLLLGSGDRILSRKVNDIVPAPLHARPSWISTYKVGVDSFRDDPFFGRGPNQFSKSWVLHKPLNVNLTQFWALDFNNSVGAIPTYIINSGVFGLIAWLAFIVVFIVVGVRYWRAKAIYGQVGSFATVLMVSSAYMWIWQIAYVPGILLSALTYILSGTFVASLVNLRLRSNLVLTKESFGRAQVGVVLFLVVFGLATVSAGYHYVNAYRAFSAYNSALSSSSSGDISLAMADLNRAISLDKQDVYYRTLSELLMTELFQSTGSANNNPEAVRVAFVNLFDKAVTGLQGLEVDDYQNYLTLGNVYESTVQFKLQGAYEQAKQNYEVAASLNPTNPFIPFAQARLEVANGTPVVGIPLLNKSLALKSNYAPAYILASQIAFQGGDIETAIKNIQSGIQSAPLDFSLHFQLGYLRYQSGEYKLAILPLERALSLNPAHSNIRYFLGLSYYRSGRQDEAIEIFKALSNENPSNDEIKNLLGSMTNGQSLSR